MGDKIISLILTILAWFFGVVFILGGILELFEGSLFFGLLIILGGLLLLPSIKSRIISRAPKLKKGVLTGIGTTIALTAIVIGTDPVIESDDVELTAAKSQIQAKPDTQPKALVATQEVVEPKADDKLAVDKKDTVSNPFTNGTIDDVPIVAAEPVKPEPITPPPEPDKTESVKVEKPPINDCAGLPRTCGKMANCAQARKALECGNSRLDRDGDGVPCESIC